MTTETPATDPGAPLAARVRCCLCDHDWHPASTGVLRYPLMAGRWWCADREACAARRAVLLARMQRVLDAVWELL